MTRSSLCRILTLTLFLSTRVSGDQLSDESGEAPGSFNETLILYNEATESLSNLTGSISDLTEEIEENIKLKNEVVGAVRYDC